MSQQPFWAHILYGACQSWPQGLTPMRPLTAGKKTNHYRLLWSSQGEKRSPTASENMCSVFVKHYENQRIYHDFSIKKAFFVVQLWWENYLLTGTWNLNVNTLEEKWNQKMMVAFFGFLCDWSVVTKKFWANSWKVLSWPLLKASNVREHQFACLSTLIPFRVLDLRSPFFDRSLPGNPYFPKLSITSPWLRKSWFSEGRGKI